MSSNQAGIGGNSPSQGRAHADSTEQQKRGKARTTFWTEIRTSLTSTQPVTRSGSVRSKAETDLQKVNFHLSEQVSASSRYSLKGMKIYESTRWTISNINCPIRTMRSPSFRRIWQSVHVCKDSIAIYLSGYATHCCGNVQLSMTRRWKRCEKSLRRPRKT